MTPDLPPEALDELRAQHQANTQALIGALVPAAMVLIPWLKERRLLRRMAAPDPEPTEEDLAAIDAEHAETSRRARDRVRDLLPDDGNWTAWPAVGDPPFAVRISKRSSLVGVVLAFDDTGDEELAADVAAVVARADV